MNLSLSGLLHRRRRFLRAFVPLIPLNCLLGSLFRAQRPTNGWCPVDPLQDGVKWQLVGPGTRMRRASWKLLVDFKHIFSGAEVTP